MHSTFRGIEGNTRTSTGRNRACVEVVRVVCCGDGVVPHQPKLISPCIAGHRYVHAQGGVDVDAVSAVGAVDIQPVRHVKVIVKGAGNLDRLVVRSDLIRFLSLLI